MQAEAAQTDAGMPPQLFIPNLFAVTANFSIFAERLTALRETARCRPPTTKNRNDMDNKELMMRAIALSEESVRRGGGPFGAVIAKDGEIVAEASNSVTPSRDPTAHAEVNAIRKAAARLGTYDLSGCMIFTSCEPCPMCLGAIYWAHIDRVYYANDRKDAAEAGFDDDFIYKELALPPAERHKPSAILLPNEAKRAFRMWKEKDDKREY